MVNLEWLRTFKTVYETGSLSAAARELYISQPGASLHLDSLENQLGIRLYDRGTRKLVPTEQGKALYNSIFEIFKDLEEVEKKYDKCNNNKISLSIGMCFETFQMILEPYIRTIDFDLVSKFGDYHKMLSDLDRGMLDFVISSQKKDNFNFVYTPFAKEKIMLIAGSKTDLSEFETQDKDKLEAWLRNQTWFGTANDMEHLQNFWTHNFKKRANISPNYIVPNISSIIRCLSNNNGLAVAPDFLCKEQIKAGEIISIWEGYRPLDNDLYFVHRKKTIYAKEIETIKDIFKNAFK